MEAARLVLELFAERLEAPQVLESGRRERAADERRTRRARRLVPRRASAVRADAQELRVFARLVEEARPAHLVPVGLRRARALEFGEARHLQQVRLLEAQALEAQARELHLIRRLHAHLAAARCAILRLSCTLSYCSTVLVLYIVQHSLG